MQKLQITEKGIDWYDSVKAMLEDTGGGAWENYSTDPKLLYTFKQIREQPVELSRIKYPNKIDAMIRGGYAITINSSW